MPKSITYVINLSGKTPTGKPPRISLTNVNSGRSQAFSNLDNAIQYLDATYTRRPDTDQKRRKGAAHESK